MKEFSFGILTYNHEDFIVELLESIKFQVCEYGNDIQVHLYIVDDKSSDSTPGLIDKWLNNNKTLFQSIEFTKNDENKGTVHNHNFLINSVKTNHMKIIAGDDVLTSQNIFEICKVDDKTLKACSCIILKNGKLEPNRLAIRLALYNNKYINTKRKRLNFLSWYNWIITPEAIFTKALYADSKCRDYNKNCVYAEDICAWYAMLKNNNPLKIEISKSIPAYWRQSEKSISNSQIEKNIDIKQQWYADIYQFKKLILNDVDFINKFLINRQIKRYKKTGSWYLVPKILDEARYKFKLIDLKMKLPKNKELENEWVNDITKTLDYEVKHYKKIQKIANNFINEFKK